MTTVIVAIVWTAVASFVALAVYRQVRAHVGLRRSLRDWVATHELLMDKLTAAIDLIAGAPAEEAAAVGPETRGEPHPRRSAVVLDYLALIRRRSVDPHFRSSDDLVRAWQEDEDEDEDHRPLHRYASEGAV